MSKEYKAPDGTIFDTKRKYSNYMMDNYYSFKEKENENLSKYPGDIDGQVFDISNCTNSNLVVMDMTEQVQIDDLTNCNVFIGACTSTVFVRNCSDCMFFTCSRQLRVTECNNSTFYAFSESEIHIELCNNVRFAPFIGGYPQQEDHFKTLGLNPKNNHWYQIYDHSDPNNVKNNWSLVNEDEYEEGWFPEGSCTQFIPIDKPFQNDLNDKSKNQVGQSFGVDQMILDSNEIKKNQIESDLMQISMEAALLIETAPSKNIDVSTWLGEKSNFGKAPVEEFKNKLIGIATMMGINEDNETKRQIELAISNVSLKAIESVCKSGKDEMGNTLIDVTYFLKLCKVKVEKYVNENNFDENQLEEERDLPLDDDVFIQKELDKLNENVKMQQDSGIGDIAMLSVEDYIKDLKSKGSPNFDRPQSAPGGIRSSHRNQTNEVNLSISEVPAEIKKTNVLPSSPFDEEVVFEGSDENDFEDIDSGYLNSRNYFSNSKVSGRQNNDWQHENEMFLMNSNKEKNLKPRHSSAGPSRVKQVNSEISKSLELAAESNRRVKNKSSGKRLRSTSMSGLPRNRISTSTLTKSKVSSEEHFSQMKDLVEDLIRNTVKKADLYHFLQIHLGFIDSYTMIPPRGSIVKSTNKDWISDRELQTAFIAARLFLTDHQIIVLKSIVFNFSKEYPKLYKEDEGSEEVTSKATKKSKHPNEKYSIGPGQTLSSFWLKKYIIHLRLSKRTSSSTSSRVPQDRVDFHQKEDSENDKKSRPIQWREWLGKKIQEELKKGPKKPKEFEKALNGQKHNLAKEDIDFLLRTYRILPEEYLHKEIENKIESWVLDMNARRDFQHELKAKIRGWIWREKILKDKFKLPENEKGYWQIWVNMPLEQRSEIKKNILSEMIKSKKEEFYSQERTKFLITKELFSKFEIECQTSTTNWKKWLLYHFENFDKSLEKFKQAEKERAMRYAKISAKKKALAGLNEIESKVNKASESMDTRHQVEIQKGIVALRRAASENGLYKGKIVTKENFDQYIKGILSPYINLDISLHPNDTQGKVYSSKLEPFRELFQNDLNSAIDRMTNTEMTKKEENAQKYNEWLAQKNAKIKEEKKKLMEEKEKKEKEDLERKNKNKKEYRKWLNLRKKNKYKSLVEGKSREVPAVGKLVHNESWKNEKIIFDEETTDRPYPHQAETKKQNRKDKKIR